MNRMLLLNAILVIFASTAVALQTSRGFIRTTQHLLRSVPNDDACAHDEPNDSQRRLCFSQPMIAVATLATLPPLANAAPPVTVKESDGFTARLDRSRRPKPPKALRSNLNQDFAVLLMRSSYVALDQLDCVAMDQFQRDFFLIRQAEYLPYIELVGPGVVQQGFLTDPYYFDFISFAQYATISREINKDPAVVFEEQQPQESTNEEEPQVFVTKVIKRDLSALPNDMLARQHSKLVGKAIIDKLEETFGSTASAIPKMKADPASIVASLTQLAKLFQLNGFAFGASASVVESSGEYCVTLLNPATLWSGKALQQRKADPINCFLLMAATEVATRAGLVVASSSVKYEGNQEKTFLKIV